MNRVLTAGLLGIALGLQSCGPADTQTAAPTAPPAAAPAAAPAAPQSAETYSTTGEIVTKTGETVTIDLQPVPALGWPQMILLFKAPDGGMIANLQQGAAVEFSFRREGNESILTDIRPRN